MSNRHPGTRSTITLLLLCLLIQPHLKAHVDVLFSPDDKPRNHLIKKINGARKRVYAALYLLTDKKICRALCDAHKRGIVDVQVICDKSCVQARSEKISTLTAHGVPVFVIIPAKRNALMHHKFAIIDQSVWTGSFNWTVSAHVRNHENVIICSQRSVIERFEQEFERLKRLCHRHHGNTAPVSSTTFWDNVRYLFKRVKKEKQA